MISVIIPVYNVALFLEEAIESVLHQTYTDLEIILVDDGSTDGSGEICDKNQKKDSRIKVIHQENRGLSAARNTGIDICKGEMIAFLDSDDAFCKDMLQKMSDAMLKTGADIVECNYVLYNGVHSMDPKKIRKKKKWVAPKINRTGLYTKREALHLKVEEKIAANVWNKLYNRKIWNSLRFPEGQNYEDIDIILPLLGEAEKVYILDEVLVMYRVRQGSISRTYTVKNIRELELAYRHFFEYIQSHSPEYFDEKDMRMALIGRYDMMLGQYYYICSRFGFPEKKNCIDLLRKQILDAKSKIDIRECSLKTRGATFIFSFAPPGIAGIIFRVFKLLKFFMQKVTFR